MAVLTFEQMAGQYDPAIATGVNAVLQNAITGNAEVLTDALTLYMLILGGLMCFREIRWGTFVAHSLRAAGVSTLLTAAAFNTLIAQPAMNTIPNWVAQTVNAQTGVTAAPQQFDLIWSATKHQEAAILQQATGLENVGYRMEAAGYTGAAGFLLTVVFWMYEFSRAIMGLVVCVVPFVAGLYLFEATRGVPMRVLEKGIGILILQLMLSIVIQIVIKGDAYIVVTSAQNAPASLDGQIGAFEDLLVWFLFGTGLVIFIPGIAAYFGGGVALSVGGTIVTMTARAVPFLARAGGNITGRVGRAGSRAIGRARGT